ncbi:MAG: DUF4097 family beta strand repeat-containing protein [Rhodanobacter sp.]
MKAACYLPLLLCLGVGSALAHSPIQLQHAASATARISISNIAGSVNVTAWDRDEVQVSGELGEGAKPLEITGDNNHLVIKVAARSGSGWLNFGGDDKMSPSTLEVNVPRAASLEVNVISAPLVVDGLVGGNIKISAISGSARIHAHIRSLEANSVSGSIELSGHADQASLQTVSGEILAPALGTTARLQTISGRIQAGSGPWQKLSLSTVSGDVQLRGGLTSGGDVDIESMSGDVQWRLPTDTSAMLHASSFSGNLRSDFGTPVQARHGPGSSLDTTIGAGNGKIHIETFSGNLRVRKQDDAGPNLPQR